MRCCDGGDNFRGYSLAWFEVDNEHQFFANHGSLGPKEIRGEDAEFLYRQALENIFDVLGIDVLAFFGDDHILSPAEKLQMAGGVELSEVAGHEPTVDDGLRGQFWIVEIMRHDHFAAHGNFADAIRIWIHNFHFHAGKGFANGVRAEWL